MSYNTNPWAPRARRDAVNEVRYRGLTQAQVARKYGVSRSAVCKWFKKAPEHNREYINTLPSRPKSHPNQLPEGTIKRLIELRLALKRCAIIIHAHLSREGYQISLSSVKRILKRYNLVRKKRQAKDYVPLPRPLSDCPGSLVQMDTIHFVKTDGSRFYVWAVIDTYSRLAHAEYHPKLRQTLSFQVIRNAQRRFGFKFNTVQTDNGPEFKDYLRTTLRRSKTVLRHSRVRRPNDNAHVERLIRTIQEECFQGRIPNQRTISRQLEEYLIYYNQQRLHLSLGCLTPSAFVSKVLN